MTIPTQVTFRAMEPSEALRQLIFERVQRLERLAGDILSCDVTVEHDGSRHHQGNPFDIHARLTMRGTQLDVRGGSKSKAHKEDAYALVADTFDALRRKLEEHVRKRRDFTRDPKPVA